MSIWATIHTDSTGNIIIEMQGGLNYENSAPLRDELNRLAKKNPRSTITLDFNNIDFVGSSGIGQFVETLNFLNRDWSQIRLSNVKSEFVKVFKLYKLSQIEVIVDRIDEEVEQNIEKFHALRKNYRI